MSTFRCDLLDCAGRTGMEGSGPAVESDQELWICILELYPSSAAI